jgi:acetyl-CoA acetyltransferase
MGLTAEKVAAQWKVSREDQDAFALQSHQKALKAMAGRRVQRRDDAGDRGRPHP